MPGLIGIISRQRGSGNGLPGQFQAMIRLLTHFNYYQTEHLDGDDYCLGWVGIPCRGYRHVRRDPISLNAAAFDGFVYGWRGSCRSTTPWNAEPIALVPLEDGDDLEHTAERINGSFTMTLHKADDDRFMLSTDRLGFRRLYYYEDSEVIAFAPEIKAFLAIEHFRRELDFAGAADFFNYGFLIDDRTLYKQVKLLRPASTLIVQDRRIAKLRRYWWHQYTDELEGDSNRLGQEMHAISQDLLHRQLGGSQRLLMGLSGGMDSRYLVYLLSGTDKDVTCSTYGDARCDDVRIARLVSKALGLGDRFRQIEFDPLSYAKYGTWAAWLTDGMVDLIYPSHTLGVLQEFDNDPVRYEYLNSVWSGRVNYTMTWGKSSDIGTSLTFDQKMARLTSMMGLQYLDQAYYSLFAPDFRLICKSAARPHIEQAFRAIEHVGKHFLHQKDSFTLLTRTLRLHHQYDPYRYYFAEHFALIDDDIVEFRNRIPLNWVVDRRLYTKMLCDQVPVMASIIYPKTGTSLYEIRDYRAIGRPDRLSQIRYWAGRLSLGRICWVNRRTFLHQDIWYRKYPKNRRFFEEILLDPQTARRGFYNSLAAERLLRKQAHGSSNYEVIAKLATFELFQRYFIDGYQFPTAPFTISASKQSQPPA